ncbi:hypothetical protein C8Q77DRAFT_501900 [Trametes polyzona]|nr:hypothetical protein C8Q77DRAFT_501900 [Trametes polyzona]
MSGRVQKQSMSELKLRRLTEHNQRLREDLARPRIRVSEASRSLINYCKSTPDHLVSTYAQTAIPVCWLRGLYDMLSTHCSIPPGQVTSPEFFDSLAPGRSFSTTVRLAACCSSRYERALQATCCRSLPSSALSTGLDSAVPLRRQHSDSRLAANCPDSQAARAIPCDSMRSRVWKSLRITLPWSSLPQRPWVPPLCLRPKYTLDWYADQLTTQIPSVWGPVSKADDPFGPPPTGCQCVVM